MDILYHAAKVVNNIQIRKKNLIKDDMMIRKINGLCIIY